MSAATKNAYLVNKIAFFQNCNFTTGQRYFNSIQTFDMKFLFAFLLVPFLSVSKCGHKKHSTESRDTTAVNDSIPACVQKLIDEGNKERPPNAPLQVDEYIYKNKKVFLFTAQCCDQFNMLYDDSCKAICAPSGGFTGRGDMKCGDFDSTAKHIKLIWKNPIK